MKSPLDFGQWIVLDEVPSTQDYASGLLRVISEGPSPGVVLAHHQTSGRGRFDRNWYSQKGESLTMSLVFQAYPDHPRPWLIGMAVAAACAAAIHCRLTWPNDLVVNKKKLGGILSQLVTDKSGQKVMVVGVGINLNVTEFPADIADRATSLAIVRPGQYDAEEIARHIIERISFLPEPDSWNDLRPVWALFDSTPGKLYRLPSGEEALAIGIGPEGELLCAVEGETQTVLAADALFGSG